MINDRVLGLLVEMTVANHHLHAPDTEIKECHHDLCERARIVVLDHAIERWRRDSPRYSSNYPSVEDAYDAIAARVVAASKDVEAT